MSDVESPVPAPVPGTPVPRINPAIYGTPMFATPLMSYLDATVS